MASTAGEGTSYGGTGGAGGKFRKRPFRKPQATPYDRPQTAVRNPSEKSWLSMFVDPASKLISASAHLFFNSLLRKRLPPPPPSTPQPEASGEAEERSQQAVVDNGHGDQGPIADDGGKPTHSSGLSELEQILKQKTFTRSEIQSLTELLQSRTIDLPNGDKQKGTISNQQQLVCASGLHDQVVCSPVQEKNTERRLEESRRLQGSISTPLLKSQVLEDDVAAPAELAKAYMGSRPSKVSPSLLGLRNRALREDGSMLSNSAFPPSPSVLSLARKPAVNFGISENGFMTPRSRGRSAIYNMARTPYSRGQPSSSQQGAGSVYDAYSGTPASFSSQFTSDRDGHYSSKHSTLKRRSSALEDDIGSVGPIRRLRQKTNLAPPRSSAVPVRGTPYRYVNGGGSDGSQNATGSAQKLLALDESEHKFSKAGGKYEDSSMPSTSYSQVPSKSSETASRILQQLEKIVPKEKSSEGKSLSVRDKSPSKLTSNMLRGQALKSIEAVDSSNFLYNATDKRKSLDLQKTSSPDTKKHDKVKESISTRSVGSSDALASAGIGRASFLVQEAAPVAKTSDSYNQELVKSSQKKQGFRMTAVEDLEELDDENNSDAAASVQPEEGKGKLDSGLVESKAASSSGNPSMEKSYAPEVRLSAGTVFNKSTGERTSDGIAAGQEKFAFSFSAPFSGAVTQPDAASTHSKSAFEKEPRESPVSSAHDEKVGSLVFSSSSTASESLVPESSRPASALRSFTSHAYGETDIVPKPTFDKVENKEAQKSESALGKPEVSSTISASTSKSSMFSFGAPANNSNLSNGSSDSRLPTSSSAPPFQFSEGKKQMFTKSPSNEASSTSATNSVSAPSTLASNSSPTIPAASPPPSFPSFGFGATSGAPANSVSTETATFNSGPALVSVKLEKETSGNHASLPSNGTSFALGSKGTSSFGLNATINSSSSAAINLTQSSPFSSGSGSLATTESVLAGTGSASVTQSVPFKFGSSASSPVFGTSGVGSFASGSSVFGSSTSGSLALSSSSSGSAQFGSSGSGSFAFGSSGASSSAFGSSASGSSIFGSSTTGSSMFGSSTIGSSAFGSSTTASSSPFGSSTTGTSTFGSSTLGTPTFGSSTSGSSMFGSSTSGSSSTPGFMFGASTSGSSPFGSSTQSPAVFSFGASSSAATTNNNAPLVFGSSTTASAAAPVFSFTSASTSAPSSQAQPVFGNSAPSQGQSLFGGPAPSSQPVFGSSFPSFGATAGNNGDQMSMEDSMAEDSMTPKVPAFGQSPIGAAQTPGFMFGSPAPSTGTPSFQFGGQPSQPNNIQQNTSPFQASGSLGGSFSLGSGGPDKANRRIVKVKHSGRRKK